jgi:flagellar biosynthesis/type III secretory pathway protein FliH
MKLTCKECGEDLEFDALDLTDAEINVKPCTNCSANNEYSIKEAYDEGFIEGKEEGYDDASNNEYTKGYDVAVEEIKTKLIKLADEF